LAKPGVAVVAQPCIPRRAERRSVDLAARGPASSAAWRAVWTRQRTRALSRPRKRRLPYSAPAAMSRIPKRIRELAEQILALEGAVISEFPVGTFRTPPNLPIPNRIISGMPGTCRGWKRWNTTTRRSPPAAPWSRIATHTLIRATLPTKMPAAQPSDQAAGRHAGCDPGRCLGRTTWRDPGMAEPGAQ
jgi:hypothetical protein